MIDWLPVDAEARNGSTPKKKKNWWCGMIGPPIVAGEIVAVERRVRVVRTRQRILRVHRLVVEVVAGQSMPLISAGLGGHGELDRTRAAVFHGEGVDLSGRFLNDVRIRSQVQHALANRAGGVEAVHDPHVGNGSLTVGADVNGAFGGIVVHAGAWRVRGAQAEARDAGSQGDQRDHATAGERQSAEFAGFQRQLVARFGSIQQRSFTGDGDRFRRRANLN